MKIEGINKVHAMLERRRVAAETKSVLVGYTANYALHVHENMEAKTLGQSIPRPSGLGVFWGPSQYGPKFLEGPAREFRGEIVTIIKNAWARGIPLLQCLLLGGLKLQRESMLRVPVEYGNLRASAFTKEDEA